MGTWLLAASTVVAPMRLATKRSRSGWTVRSFLPTIYQLGLVFHAVPSTFCVNRSGTGTGLRCPDEFLLRFGQIAGEIPDAVGLQPDPAISDFDVGEHIGRLCE